MDSENVAKSTERVVNSLIEALNLRDLDRLVALFSEDAEFAEFVGTGRIAYGREAIRALWKNFFDNVSKKAEDNQWVIHRKIIDGNSCAVERTSHIKFKGRPIVIEMVAIMEVRDGKIQVYRDYGDSRIFIAQNNNEGW